jgi:hypothetical protein
MVGGYSSVERRANVKKQLRDRKGRWIEMGLKVRYLFNGKYVTGEVTGIDVEADEVTLKSPDGAVRVQKSKTLEGIGAKASLPGKEEKPAANLAEPTPVAKKTTKTTGTKKTRQTTAKVPTTAPTKKPMAKPAAKKMAAPKKAQPVQKEAPKTEIPKKGSDVPGVSRDQVVESIRVYISGTYRDINSQLRGKPAALSPDRQAEVDSTIDVLEQAIQANKLSEPLSVYRGLQLDAKNPASKEFLDSIQPGAQISDAAFMSTTDKRSTALGFAGKWEDGGVLFEMDLDAGDPALRVRDYHLRAIESELILPQGTSWEVTEVRQDEESPGVTVAKIRRAPTQVPEPEPETSAPEEFGIDYKSDISRPVASPPGKHDLGEHASALVTYIDPLFPNYNIINGTLRNPEDEGLSRYTSPEQALESIPALQDLTRSYETDKPITVYRVVEQDVVDSLEVGDILTDHGFTSTATSVKGTKEVSVGLENSANLVINIPAGTKGVDVNALLAAIGEPTSTLNEDEFLLPDGMKFRLTQKGSEYVGEDQSYYLDLVSETEGAESDTDTRGAPEGAGPSTGTPERGDTRREGEAPSGVPGPDNLESGRPSDNAQGADREVEQGDLRDKDGILIEPKALVRFEANGKSLQGRVISERDQDGLVTVNGPFGREYKVRPDEAVVLDRTPKTAGDYWKNRKRREELEEINRRLGLLTRREDALRKEGDPEGNLRATQETRQQLEDRRSALLRGEDDIPSEKAGTNPAAETVVSETPKKTASDYWKDRKKKEALPGWNTGEALEDDIAAEEEADEEEPAPPVYRGLPLPTFFDDEIEELSREELEEQIIDLQIEEDVLRAEQADKDEIREIQARRFELQRRLSALNRAAEEEKDREATEEKTGEDESSEEAPDGNLPEDGDDEDSTETPGSGRPDGPDDGDDEHSKPKPTPDLGLPGNEDDEHSTEKPGGGGPGLPDNKDDEHTAPTPAGPTSLLYPPNPRDDAVVVPREPIDVADIDGLVDGDRVLLEETINGSEDITDFLRDSGFWHGANDYEDLELDPEALKDYIEERDPKDLFAERAADKAMTAPTPDVGTKVAFTVGGADGAGRVAGVDKDTGTVEVSVEEGTVSVPLDSVSPPAAGTEDAPDGPINVYTPPAIPFSERFPNIAETGPLSTEEQTAYGAARSRLALLQGRGSQEEGAVGEMADLIAVIEALHYRAVDEFAKRLQPLDSTAVGEGFPAALPSLVTNPIDAGSSEEYSQDAAAAYGPTDLEASSINADIRAGYADASVLELQDLLLRSALQDNVSLYREEYVPLEVAEQMTVGRVLRNESFMGTMKSPEESSSYVESLTSEDERIGKVAVAFRIETDAGAPGIDLSGSENHGNEVLLPAGVELEVKDVGWDAPNNRLSVVASYDGTSVSSVADLTDLEDNDLRSPDTTLEDLQAALAQTNEEVNKHQFSVVVAELQGVEQTDEAVRKLERAEAVRDSVTALIAVREQSGSGQEPITTSAPEKIADAERAAELVASITGTDEDSQAMRAALESVATEPGSSAFVLLDSDGNVRAAASVVEGLSAVDGADSAVPENVWLSYLGATNDADGSEVFNALVEDAASQNLGILLEPSDDDEDYWTQSQGMVSDPFGTGTSAVGFTAEAAQQRVEQGHPADSGIPTYAAGPQADDSAVELAALRPGDVVNSVEGLASLPQEAWVGVSSSDGPTEMFRRDEDGHWLSSIPSPDDKVLTDEELLARSEGLDTTLWFEGTSAEPPSVETETEPGSEVKHDDAGRSYVSDMDGNPIHEGDTVTSTENAVSSTVDTIEDDGLHVQTTDPEGNSLRLATDTLR